MLCILWVGCLNIIWAVGVLCCVVLWFEKYFSVFLLFSIIRIVVYGRQLLVAADACHFLSHCLLFIVLFMPAKKAGQRVATMVWGGSFCIFMRSGEGLME